MRVVASDFRRSTETSRTESISRALQRVVGPDTASEMNLDVNGGRITNNNRTGDVNGEAALLNGNDRD